MDADSQNFLTFARSASWGLVFAVGVGIGTFAGWSIASRSAALHQSEIAAASPSERSEPAGPRLSASSQVVSGSSEQERVPVSVDPLEEPNSPESANTDSNEEPDLIEALSEFDRALFAHPVWDGTDDPFLAKYDGATIEEMLVAKLALTLRMRADRDKILTERLDQGIYIEEFLPEGSSPAPKFTTTADQPFVTYGSRTIHGNGFDTIHTTHIPAEEYPEFEALSRELWWLQGHLKSKGIE